MATHGGAFAFAAFRRAIAALHNDARVVGAAFDALMGPGVLPVLLAQRRRPHPLGALLSEISRDEYRDERQECDADNAAIAHMARQYAVATLQSEQLLRADEFTEQVVRLRARPAFVHEWWAHYETAEIGEFCERERRVRAHTVERETARSERAARVMHARLVATREQLLRTIRMWEWTDGAVANGALTAASVYETALAEAAEAAAAADEEGRQTSAAGAALVVDAAEEGAHGRSGTCRG